MPSIITDPAARKMAVKHFVNYAERSYTRTAEQLEPFLHGATCSVDESGHLKIAKEIKTDFPSRKLAEPVLSLGRGGLEQQFPLPA